MLWLQLFNKFIIYEFYIFYFLRFSNDFLLLLFFTFPYFQNLYTLFLLYNLI
jgi:hypothetical protein